MTTKVIIQAHCAKTKEVSVTITDGDRTSYDGANVIEFFRLQDGESAERYVYDARQISVREDEKP